MREPGFYWVKFIELDWVVCQWYNEKWLMPGISILSPCKAVMTSQTSDDYEISEIDERRIVRGEFYPVPTNEKTDEKKADCLRRLQIMAQIGDLDYLNDC